MSVNQQAAQPYENYLLYFFTIWTSAQPSNHSIREKILQRFTLFLSSTEYSRFWHNLYKSANVTMNSPILSCYITYKFFIEFWKGKYQLPAPSQHQQAEMNEDEKSALWYVAGYIIKKVKARLWKKKKHDMADKLKQLLEDSEIDDNVTSGTTEENNPKEWLELVNRGELTRCSNDFYEYLTVVKLAIKETVLLPHTKSVPLPETTRTLPQQHDCM